MCLPQPEDGHQGLVDAPLLVRGHPAYQVTEPPSVHGSDLLNQDAGGLAEQLDLGAERGRSCAARCRRDQHHRTWQELIGLDDHSIASAVLLVTGPAWQAELVNVTPQHA